MTTARIFLLLATLLLLPSPAMAGAIAVLQHQPGDPARPWTWALVTKHLKAIRDTGFTAILLSPHQKSCGGMKSLGYDPYDFTSFESGHGTEAELKALIDQAHALGLRVYADMVLNHMCTGSTYPRFTREHFHNQGKILNFDNPQDVLNGDLIGLKDLRQEHPYVRGELWRFVLKSHAIGFDGWRWDAAKHVPLWYWKDHILNSPIGRGRDGWNWGEVYTGNESDLARYTQIGMAVTDYPLYFRIRDNFWAGGNFHRVAGAGVAGWNGPKALTFVQNHDVGPPPYRRLAEAFIAMYPGYPSYYDFKLPDPQLTNLLWVQNHLAAGDYIPKYVDHDTMIFMRGNSMLAGFNKRVRTWIFKRIQTPWKNTLLHDHTGHVLDEWTDANGLVEVFVPPLSYVVLAPVR